VGCHTRSTSPRSLTDFVCLPIHTFVLSRSSSRCCSHSIPICCCLFHHIPFVVPFVVDRCCSFPLLSDSAWISHCTWIPVPRSLRSQFGLHYPTFLVYIVLTYRCVVHPSTVLPRSRFLTHLPRSPFTFVPFDFVPVSRSPISPFYHVSHVTFC